MVQGSKRVLGALERWSASLFLIAGGLWLIDFVSLVLTRYLGVTETNAVGGMALAVGLLLTSLGLVGLYPRVAAAAPRLARIAIGAISIAVVGFLGLVIWGIGLTILGISPMAATPDFLRVEGFRALLWLLRLGLVLFGVASVRSASPSRTVGWFLLGIAALWIVQAVGLAIGYPLGSTFIAAISGVLTLGIGYSLRTGYTPLDPQVPTDAIT